MKAVVIEVDTITLRRSSGEDVVVDTFSIDELDLAAANTFQIDLLQYRGVNQLLVVEDLELDSGSYSEVAIGILDGDVNRSYVQQADDTVSPIDVAGGALSLPGAVLASGDQTYTVVFSLAQALEQRTGSDDYVLTTAGMRLVDNGSAATLSGRVDNALFDGVSPCDEKADPESGNRLYLYEGGGLSADVLADVHTAGSGTEIPEGALNPSAVGALVRDVLSGRWQYAFGFLPAGSYTLAFACDSAADDPVEFDGITIPLPQEQQYDITLDEGEQAVCDLATDATCD